MLLKGKGVVGRLIVGGIFFPKLGLRFKGLLTPLMDSLVWSFISISSPFNKEHILGKETIGDSGKVTLKDFVFDVIVDETSLLGIDANVEDIATVDALEGLNIGNSRTGGEVRIEEADMSSISLSFSIALASSESLQGACMSYGFSSPRISPRLIKESKSLWTFSSAFRPLELN